MADGIFHKGAHNYNPFNSAFSCGSKTETKASQIPGRFINTGKKQNQTLQRVKSRFSMFGTPAAKTRCDMDYTEIRSDGHEAYKLLKAQKINNPYSDPTFDPKWGTGKPVTDYWSAFKNLGPCMQEILVAHEEKHQDAASAPCANFRSCVDAADKSWFGGKYGQTVSLGDYIDCYNNNGAGLAPNCDTDEQAAYAVSVAKAKEIMNEGRCQAEQSSITSNLPGWEQAAKSAKCSK